MERRLEQYSHCHMLWQLLVSIPMARTERHSWVLLIHALPARPLYLRARIRQMLLRSGAAAIKKAVYALPRNDESLARLEEIARTIRGHGAVAYVCEATFTDPGDDAAVIQALRTQSAALYRRLATQLRVERTRAAGGAAPARLTRLRERFDALRSQDHFDAPGATETEALLHAVARRHAPAPAGAPGRRWTGLKWVTRRGIHIDRIACAWIVRRFLDPAAEFRFVAASDHRAAAGEITLDMPGGTISHEDDRCSAETLLLRAGLADPALAHIAEIVHDLDLKDGRFGHPETAGVQQMLLGMIATHPRDEERLARGSALLDDLYASLSQRRVPTPPTLSPRPPRRGREDT
jgi:hypothetical protein